MDAIRVALRAELVAAMRRRDRAAVSVYRTTLAAIENAEAVPAVDGVRAGAVEVSPVGVGGADVARVVLSEEQVRGVVAAEVAERRSAAELLAADAVAAGRLVWEAELLDALLARV